MTSITHVLPRKIRSGAVVLAMLAFAPLAHAADVLVFAAASLKPALDTILATPEAQSIGNIKTSYAASSQLARQIESGAPAALFISADRDWMDYVAERQLIVEATRVDLLGNALVLVAPAGSPATVLIGPQFDLAGALGNDGRLAIGEPNSVPAGKYAKAALQSLGAWSAIESRIVSADNVRAALNFVVRREAPLGIVYRSDAISEPGVRVLDSFAASTHPPIVYPAAVLREHDDASARAALALLRTPESQAIFKRFGFDAPPK